MIQSRTTETNAYQRTIDYLFSRLPMFSRIGTAAFKKDLTNTRKICEFLNNPHQKFKSIHVAGTNGKGSVSHMLAAVLQTAGYKTGLYTSPHLRDFRERIKINGEMVREEFVTDFTERLKPLIEVVEPSFFEITVGMAFEYFSRQRVDIAIIETGLGGRFDSTNVITPELSIITNIGWDHMNILGETLQKIAYEKAGIIKEEIPVIIGEVTDETGKIFLDVTREKNTVYTVASVRRHAVAWHWEKNDLVVEVARQDRTDHQLYRLDLPGLYQTKNLLTVLEACNDMQKQGWNIQEEDIKLGLQQTKKLTGLHGRWETIHEHPLVVLDVAHNADGMKMLLEQVEVTDHDHLHIVLGVVKDKDIDRMLSLLPKLAKYYFTQADIPRALRAETLVEEAKEFQLEGEVFSNVNEALMAAKDRASREDLILVCGSLFLVGDVQV